jgi:AbiV family abortive infection protein
VFHSITGVRGSLSNLKGFEYGLEACMANAELWLNESNSLYHQGSYGHCCALLIHGAEALAQAYTCWTVIQGLEAPDSEEVKVFFRDHRPKTDTLLGILGSLVAIEKLLNEKDEYPFHLEYTDEDLEKGFIELTDASYRFYRGFMDLRNQGIYVNFDPENNLFSSPLDMNKDVADILGKLIFYIFATIHYMLNATEEEIKEIKQNYERLSHWTNQRDSSDSLCGM